MPISENDCYGIKKADIVKTYFLNPLAKLKLIPGQEKNGCCGKLTDLYYIFSFTGIKNCDDKGVFFVGDDCAEQMIEMVNTIKSKSGKDGVTMLRKPPLFDPSLDGGFRSIPYENITPINKDALTLIHLLASLWNIKNFKGALANILERIVRNPAKSIGGFDIEKLNEIVSKDTLIAGRKCKTFQERIGHEREKGVAVGAFTFCSLTAILDYLKGEGKVKENFIE